MARQLELLLVPILALMTAFLYGIVSIVGLFSVLIRVIVKAVNQRGN